MHKQTPDIGAAFVSKQLMQLVNEVHVKQSELHLMHGLVGLNTPATKYPFLHEHAPDSATAFVSEHLVQKFSEVHFEQSELQFMHGLLELISPDP